MTGSRPLRSKGTDENAEHFWKYPLYDSFRSKVGLKKFKKDLQLSDEYSMILYVVLKAHAFSWPSGSVG